MFDTNVWITIEGVSPNVFEREQAEYSELLKKIKSSDYPMVTNDYVIGEFHNRCCRLLYDSCKLGSNDPKFPGFKAYRKSVEFAKQMQSVRELCDSIISDCTFVPVTTECDINSALDELTGGHIDFSDLILREYCKKNDFIVVTSDFDFLNCGLDIITSNRKLIRNHNPNQ